jgi:hypothetical protein
MTKTNTHSTFPSHTTEQVAERFAEQMNARLDDTTRFGDAADTSRHAVKTSTNTNDQILHFSGSHAFYVGHTGGKGCLVVLEVARNEWVVRTDLDPRDAERELQAAVENLAAVTAELRVHQEHLRAAMLLSNDTGKSWDENAKLIGKSKSRAHQIARQGFGEL